VTRAEWIWVACVVCVIVVVLAIYQANPDLRRYLDDAGGGLLLLLFLVWLFGGPWKRK
jgi:hypothetical protein